MSFTRPDLPTLIERAIADIEVGLPGADARVRRSNLNVLARVSAGAAHGLYGYLAYLARQILPDTAEAEFLERHARIWLPSGRIPAAYANGKITVTGTEGTALPVGTVWKRADGAAYVSTAEALIPASGTATLSVAARQPGQAGHTGADVTLTLDNPIAGINARATVTEAITGGAEVESDSSLLTRLLARIQNPPMGGAAHDYIAWAKEVPGVTRVWVYPLAMGDGTVTVRFVRDGDAEMIPDPAEVAAVQAHIDAVRPATAHVFVVAPAPLPLNFRINLTPNLPSARAAVEANLRDLLLREAAPQGDANEGRILLSHIHEAISIASGETDHTLLAPTANITPDKGQMAVFGGIQWTGSDDR